MKVAAGSVEGFLRQPPAELTAALIYGPDTGLVLERADALLRTVVDDPSDPFRVAELTAAALRDDPARLSDEANAIALTGGRRVVLIRNATDSTCNLLVPFLSDGGGDALVIVEAGALAGRSKLRGLFEGAPCAAALPCYGDEGRGLEAVIRETLAARNVAADGEAVAFLCDNLGVDRMVSRAELEKLALYVGDGASATLADAMACVGDSAAMTLEDVAFATGAGKHQDVVRKIGRAWQEGAAPATVLRAVARHFLRLHFAAARLANGETVEAAMRSLRPPVFFKRANDFRAQIQGWPAGRIASALTLLTEAEIQCKTTGLPAQEVCGQALLRIATAAGRGR